MFSVRPKPSANPTPASIAHCAGMIPRASMRQWASRDVDKRLLHMRHMRVAKSRTDDIRNACSKRQECMHARRHTMTQ
eukprot:6873305-Alexandrium_andersonii.AAC.1